MDVDVIVLGIGPGGEDVATRCSSAGLSVVAIDEALVGGECPYWGCIPSKMMIRAGNALEEARRLPALGGRTEVTPQWETVAGRVRSDATDNWNDQAAVDRIAKAGIAFVRGHGKLVGNATVEVAGETYTAKKGIVIATGSRPAVPPIPGLEGTPYWTNHGFMEAESLPGSLLIIGGGPIGVEIGQVCARYGVKVTIVDAAPRLVANEEPEVSELLSRVFGREGITAVLGASIRSVEYGSSGFTLTCADGTYQAERLLVATGRRNNCDALGIETAGGDPDARALSVDGNCRVAPGIWAIGDVAGRGAFTHLSMYHARIAAADILGLPHEQAATHAIPRVTFTDPEIGSVGLTASQAEAAGIAAVTGTADLSASSRGWIHKEGNEGFVKIVVRTSDRTLIGATSVGPSGGEVLGLLVLAVHAGLSLDVLSTMIYAYPTFHRAIESAVADAAGTLS